MNLVRRIGSSVVFSTGFALFRHHMACGYIGFITKSWAVYVRDRGDFNSPVLVETTTAFLGQVLGPDIDQSTWAMGGFNVSDGTNNDNWWSFQDGDGFNDFLLVDFLKDENGNFTLET